MKLISLVFFLHSVMTPFSNENIELPVLRKLYYQAAENKVAAETLIKTLTPVDDNSQPVLCCYKGAAYMLDAKYSFNPITKWSRFSKGKNLIEKAIKRDPTHVEMLFLRFSIQTNLPKFLGYDHAIESDKVKLVNSVQQIKDKALKENVVNYLIASKKCTKEEIKKLQN